MTKNVVQVRVPEKLAREIENLVKKGLYKNKSEVVIDAVRHFLGSERKSEITEHIERQITGTPQKTGYSKKELEKLWETVQIEGAWKKRFGKTADEVMTTLRAKR